MDKNMKYANKVQRKKEMERRMDCHGTKDSCLKNHPVKEQTMVSTPFFPEKKLSWWEKILKFFNII
jgi:hypothetical protein